MLPDACSKEGSGASWSKHSPTRCNESPETFTLYAVKAKIGLDNKKKKIQILTSKLEFVNSQYLAKLYRSKKIDL